MYIGSFQFHSICKYKVDKAYILKNIYFFRRANLDGNQGILSILQLGEAIIQKNKAQLLLKVLRSEMMATIFGVFGPFQIRTHTTYSLNIKWQKCAGISGLWVFNEICQKMYPEKKKKKSWEPFGSCLLNSTANPAQIG